MQGNLRKNEGKFADLRKTQTDAQGCSTGIAEQANDCKQNEKLSDKNKRDHHKQKTPAGEPRRRVNEHPNADEKQCDECVPNRQSLRCEFMGKVGTTQKHAADKGSQRKR